MCHSEATQLNLKRHHSGHRVVLYFVKHLVVHGQGQVQGSASHKCSVVHNSIIKVFFFLKT